MIKSDSQGFTLIELLLVVLIIGLMLVVIVPRAWRANIDTKYGLVRQNCSELGSFAQQWAEQQIHASEEKYSTASVFNYLRSLAAPQGGTGKDLPASSWVAMQDKNNNWIDKSAPGQPNTNLAPIRGRRQGSATTDAKPECSVEEIIPPEKLPRNPFNGASIFVVANDPLNQNMVVPGALAFGAAQDPINNDFAYFAFVFQGTDSTTWTLNSATSFHAGQADNTYAGLRNGVFVARVTQSGAQ
jgi:prepilin-type N-terminal cleavage/methylation domain-containing protein